MPLTKLEYEQIEAALTMSHGHRINGEVYIHCDNTLALLERYCELEEVPDESEETNETKL